MPVSAGARRWARRVTLPRIRSAWFPGESWLYVLLTRFGRLAAGAVLLLLLIAFGAAGYVMIEGWSVGDAVYMTVITITTVGFHEVQPLSGGGRVFTVFVALFGVGVAFYILTTLVQTVIEGELAEVLGVRRMQARIESLREHYILCGFGRVGEEIGRELEERGVPFVVVEHNAEPLERARQRGILCVEGDASQDAILTKAGIERARALMAASDSDSGNTYITLTAKALNPALFVVARVGQPASRERIRRAGADRVVSPYSLAGRRMVLSALQPLTLDFVDVIAAGGQDEQLLAELEVSQESVVADRPVHDVMRECRATTLLAVQRPDGSVLAGPRGSYVLRPGDRLMLLSNEAEMEELGRIGELAESAQEAAEPT